MGADIVRRAEGVLVTGYSSTSLHRFPDLGLGTRMTVNPPAVGSYTPSKGVEHAPCCEGVVAVREVPVGAASMRAKVIGYTHLREYPVHDAIGEGVVAVA